MAPSLHPSQGHLEIGGLFGAVAVMTGVLSYLASPDVKSSICPKPTGRAHALQDPSLRMNSSPVPKERH